MTSVTAELQATERFNPQADDRFGEVYDRGYQHYEGERLGRKHAFRALTTYSMKRALGSKKSWTAKVIPVILYIAVALMVVIPLGIRAFFSDAELLEYWEFFGIVFLILTVFVATIAPEMLCNDRREDVLTLYFSRAIKRGDYLGSKLLATALLTLTLTLLPMLVYWLGRQLLEDSPLSAMKDNAGDIWRLIVAGLLGAFYLGSLGLLVSSFTGRKSIAAAVIIVGYFVLILLAVLIAESIENDTIKPYLAFIGPDSTIEGFVYGLFGQDANEDLDSFGRQLPAWQYAAAMVATIAACCGVMYWRYVPED